MKRGPQFVRYFSPVLEALKELGGSGRPSEVTDLVAQRVQVPDAEHSANKGGQSKFENRVHWARFYLAKAGYVDASTRGVWSLTEKGQTIEKMSLEQAMSIFSALQSQFSKDRAEENSQDAPAVAEESIAPNSIATSTDVDYRERLLAVLQQLPPRGLSACANVFYENQDLSKLLSRGAAGTAE